MAMFGRQATPDSDAASLAQRRLAALATQLQLEPAPAVHQRSGEDEEAGVHPGSDRADQGEDFGPGSGSPLRDEPPVPALLIGRSGRHSVRPLSLDAGRWGLDPQHVAALALLVAAVLAVAGWWVLRASPHTTPVQLANERTVPPSGGSTAAIPTGSPVQAAPVGGGVGTAATATTSPTGTVVVDVTGKVRRPGIVELPVGSRVDDALKAAGGARPAVRTNTLNLARLLVDGEQIVVGVKIPSVNVGLPPAVTGTATSAAITSVDLNTASQDQLETLPGIGPVTAAAILQWRTENGSFTSVDQLLDVSGIGDITLANIKAYVHV